MRDLNGKFISNIFVNDKNYPCVKFYAFNVNSLFINWKLNGNAGIVISMIEKYFADWDWIRMAKTSGNSSKIKFSVVAR